MSKPSIIGLGEILWDLLPAGKQLGGAPANFAYHANSLGAVGIPVSQVGRDALGQEIIDRLTHVGLDVRYIAVDPEHETGVVDVTLDAAGIPSYVIRTGAAWDFIHLTDEAKALATRADAVCFGTLAQRSLASRQAIGQFLAATRVGCLRVFDINLRQHYYTRELIDEMLKSCDVLKLNDQELPVIAELLSLQGKDVRSTLSSLFGRYELRLVALTRGPHGSLLVDRDGVSDDHPGVACQIADTVGAGDAFTAALTLGLLEDHSLKRINAFANKLAAFVCSNAGAMPKVPGSFLAER